MIRPSQEQLHGRASGSTVTGIKQSELRKLRLTFPALEEQQRVAGILGSLDDKIAVNRRINQTLEAMAQAIFKSWFVDFDPVKAKIAAKAEGRDPLRAAMTAISGKPDAELDALPPEQLASIAAAAALFPDEMEDSELGKIPKGWMVRGLELLCNLNPESWTARTLPQSVRYVDLSNTKLGEITEVQLLVGQEIPSRARRILRPGDTLIGTVRPGNRSYALVGEEGLTGSTGFAVLRPKQPYCREFVFAASTSDSNIDRLAHLADGGAYPAVRPETVIDGKWVIPDNLVLNEYSTRVAGIFDGILLNRKMVEPLVNLRDALLPRLLSGELRVQATSVEVAS